MAAGSDLRSDARMRPLTLVIALLALAAPAEAAITASQVTSSEVETFDYRYSFATPPADNTRTISGTAVGDDGDTVDVRCVDRQGGTEFSFGLTTLSAEDTWTIEGDLRGAEDPCSPRALPEGDVADLAPFLPGPEIYPGEIITSASEGRLYNWSVTAEPRPRGYANYHSLGYCGLCYGTWRDADGVSSNYLWFYNAALGSTYEWDADGDGPDISQPIPQATVDGEYAYAPYTAYQAGSSNIGDVDYVPPTFERDVDPVTGDATTTSTEALMTCPDGCATDIEDTGVRVDRTMLYGDEGQVFRIVDVWRNTGTQARDLSLRYVNVQDGGPTGVQLPGEPGFTHRSNRVVDLAPAKAVTLLVKQFAGMGVHPLDNPVGAVTMAPAADEVIFADEQDEFLLRHDFALAPGAARTITQVYTMAGTVEDTRALAATIEDELDPPPVVEKPQGGTDTGTTTTTPPAGDDKPVVTPLPAASPAALLRGGGRPKATGTGSVTVDTGFDVSCPAGGPACTADVAATAPLPVKARRKKARTSAAERRRATVGRTRLAIPAGTTRRIRIRLSPAAARELRRRRSLAIALRIALRAGNAPATTTTRTITVKAPAAKKRKKRA